MKDQELRNGLRELDESDHDVSSFEANFIETVLIRYHGNLTQKQRDCGKSILERYGIIP